MPSALQASETCVAAIQQAEGFRSAAYRDMAGVWTIGYGETLHVKQGDAITQADAEARLRQRLAACAFDVRQLVRRSLTQGELDALIDFEYNLGRAALQHSTLLAKLNAGDLAGAAAEFPRWCHADGEYVAGLLARRMREQGWFNQAA